MQFFGVSGLCSDSLFLEILIEICTKLSTASKHYFLEETLKSDMNACFLFYYTLSVIMDIEFKLIIHGVRNRRGAGRAVGPPGLCKRPHTCSH